MRLITDEQHAQIVEALSDERYVSQYSHIVEALATLQALPEVERKGWLHCGGGVTNSNPPSNFASSYKPLYATKEPS